MTENWPKGEGLQLYLNEARGKVSVGEKYVSCRRSYTTDTVCEALWKASLPWDSQVAAEPCHDCYHLQLDCTTAVGLKPCLCTYHHYAKALERAPRKLFGRFGWCIMRLQLPEQGGLLP